LGVSFLTPPDFFFSAITLKIKEIEIYNLFFN
jgi:hypothetical protein